MTSLPSGALVAGVGLSSVATIEELSELLAQALSMIGASSNESPAALATVTARATHLALVALGETLHVPVVAFEAATLAAVAAPYQSERAQRETGTGSVAEAAALLASGASELLVPRLAGAHATIAVCRVP